jgi:hypothetical protein
MRVRLTLKPGKKGTKRLLQRYGRRLVCVRYRYDERTQVRYKTIEVIIDERKWVRELSDKQVVGIRLKASERVQRWRVKQAGGVWDPSVRLWRLEWGGVRALGLEDRYDEP